MGETRLIIGNSAPHQLLDHDPDNLAHQQRVLDNPGSVVEDRGGVLVHRIQLDVAVSNQTSVSVDDDVPISHVLADVKDFWPKHSAATGDWVMIEHADDPARAELIQKLYESHFGIKTPGPEVIVALVTNGGLDFISAQLSNSALASASAVAKWMGLTANATAPAGADTTLTAEIVTAGLTRAVATYAHTAAASTYTLTITYTAVSADVPVTVAKMGVFNAISSGTLVYESLLSATATLSAAGDTLTITETVTV